MTVRLRFAPSPTGHLHIGGARTALFNYLFAKQQNGVYLLRIEDTDQKRNREEALQGFLDGFRWLGINWDEGPGVGGPYGPYSCMERLHLYQPYVEQLLKEQKAYRCFCSKEKLEAEKQAAQAAGKLYRYPGHCRHLSPEEQEKRAASGEEHVIRFRVPSEGSIRFEDLIRGEVEFANTDVEDFVIVKSDGVPTYHFAVTVDDALMKITHVVRGEEHLSNTPKQILIYQALDWDVPQFGHIPLILNPNGKKLSKRDESIVQFIDQYKEQGYLPEALLNYLALLGWSPGEEYAEEEIFSLDQLIEQFSFERVSKSGAIFDPEKLAWINAQYIKEADLTRIVDLAIPYLQKAYGNNFEQEWATELVDLLRTSIHSVSEIVEVSKIFFQENVHYTNEIKNALKEEHVPVVAEAFAREVDALDRETYTPQAIKKAFKAVQKATGYRGKQLFMPLRMIITGQNHGPDLNRTLYLLGKAKVQQRLQKWQTALQ